MKPNRASTSLIDHQPLLMVMVLTCGLLAHLSVGAQIRYSKKADLPAPEPNVDWFLDTLKHKVWYYPGGGEKWESLNLFDFQPFETCGNILILPKMDGSEIYLSKSFFSPFSYGDSLFCGQSVVTFFSKKEIQIIAIPPQGIIAKRLLLPNAPLQLETLNGRKGYCLYSCYGHFSIMEQSDIRTWGIIDRENGQWLIQPIYDEPFHFKNGIAEVGYYGQKRKINEQGEFVE